MEQVAKLQLPSMCYYPASGIAASLLLVPLLLVSLDLLAALLLKSRKTFGKDGYLERSAIGTIGLPGP